MTGKDTFDCDILIVGGGINGAGIARDAAGRGYSVILAEMNDLASGTSSASTKLIHGGLRYLEHYEFRLVREALIEREILWGIAPHIIRPLRFVLPHHRGLRPAWLLRLGLFLYDHLGGRKVLPPTRTLNLRKDPAGAPLRDEFTRGFEYSDAWVQDARLVVLNVRDAADRGAEILTRTKVVALARKGEVFEARLRMTETGAERRVKARMVVNASGPWVDSVIGLAANAPGRNVRLVQGSHIVVRKLYEHDRCYIFQNADNRIIFAIPYEDQFTLIGTTDRDYIDDPAEVAITEAETEYLLRSASSYFKRPVSRDDLVWAYSGVRPLFDDGASQAQQATRDYVLKLDKPASGAGMVNIFGGKITTYRRLAESVMQMVEQQLGARGKSWTGKTALPGGGFGIAGMDELVAALQRRAPAVPHTLLLRLARAYGTLAHDLIDTRGTLGELIGAGLYSHEVDLLMDREWAREPEDILWRRTKLGLHLTPAETQDLAAYMTARRQAMSPAA
ncbi:glycerol-3-phosphate dehydrogenase [Devosia honganensis]|uniref:Glycerol-3-phosphate dehydrogenase n=1 Tax=Devosia honganensis TaxID=1610527 RepID=A0ABV7WX92_9HYPH